MTSGEHATGDSPKAHYGKVTDKRLTADEMDIRRKENVAYEYLCHLEEAKVWMEACINESLPLTTELEESLRNGVALGKLGHFMAPEDVALRKIYDKDLGRYQARGLHFRHTDNTVHFLKAMAVVGLPGIFYPETTDIYDRKNMPRVIYCIHALSLYLFKLGKAPQIQDLYGKIKFTDDEISAMRLELEKYGIQMPAFSKIGGILANEMPVDEAALHAAIIAINGAIDKQIAEDTIRQLENPAAHLDNLNPQYAPHYQHIMCTAKTTKTEIARNKSLDPDSSYVPDIYDELLTQAELQGNINKLNTAQALCGVETALAKQDLDLLTAALTQSPLTLRDVRPNNMDIYMNALCMSRHNKQNTNNNFQEDTAAEEAGRLGRDEIQLTINAANANADVMQQKESAIQAVNAALVRNDPHATMAALKHPALGLPAPADFASHLYHVEMRNMKLEKQASLDYDEILGGVKVLSAIGLINQAVDAGDSRTTFATLSNAESCIMNLDPDCKEKYQHVLETARHGKAATADPSCPLLTHGEVQSLVNEVNDEVVDENDRIMAVNRINQALDNGDAGATLQALAAPAAKLQDVDENVGATYYQLVLSAAKHQRQEESVDPTAVLWYQDIQKSVHAANVQAFDAAKMSVGVAAINLAIDSEGDGSLYRCLTNPDVGLHSVTSTASASYQTLLRDYKQRKMAAAASSSSDPRKKGRGVGSGDGGDVGSGWMMNRTRECHKYYFNVHSMEAGWERTEAMKKDHSLLTREEIQSCLAEVTAANDRHLLFKANEKFVVKTQALVRGHLARKQFREKRAFMMDQLPAILKIQSWWRMVLAQKLFEKRRLYLLGLTNYAVRIQALVRMFLARKKFVERTKYLKKNEWAAVKIQAFVRSKWAVKDYRLLMHGENPPLSVVRKFVHLLDQGDIDYAQEIEAERLRREVVTEIRSNQSLEEDLNTMDIKIGLLVKNRITLQDVISQHKTLKKYRENNSNTLPKGLKALSKQSRERLEAYQHLFYLLQTNPIYLAKLIFEMPQNRTTKFMESVILTLYNYASNQREEYLLLRLFKSALEEEIRNKVDKMSDIVTGNPLVVKMIVSFNRNQRGQSALRELLNPLVSRVLDDKQLAINTNPVEVYKAWVNQMETDSGRASGLPYDVTVEQALRHTEVCDRINQSVKVLQKVTDTFLDAILSNLDKIPYGMRYMAKVMRDALRAKFPHAPEKDILKIIGNLIYYRFINSAIVAPDAFDIIDVGAHRGLSNDQRRNLGSIAKILQFAASNKGFGGDSAHLSHLNSYIMEAHNKFKRYFRAACEVDEPELRFNMDQYTDVTRVSKPLIYISLAEVMDTHRNLLEHQDAVAPDPADPLHDILDDLGEVPDVETLLGDVNMDESNGGTTSKAALAKTEISLTLSSKFDVIEDEKSDLKAVMVKTKQLVVEVIRCQRGGDTLPVVLASACTPQEEASHQALVRERQRSKSSRAAVGSAETSRQLSRQTSMLADMAQPLETVKQKVRAHLKRLEEAGIVHRSNHYQELLNSIVQDQRNQRSYRTQRRHELNRLRTTLKSLSAKRTFFEEQIDYYNQYVKTCLDNLATKGRKSSSRFGGGGSNSGSKDSTLAVAPKAKGSIKYSAARLHEKGVILEIEGLPTNQFKNVLFEIHATPVSGVFDVNAKFMGVNMDKVQLVFQDLLQLQYEGVAVMHMFDKAKVNVNLLIFMLNKKFYGKK